jgi:hypothetical protein
VYRSKGISTKTRAGANGHQPPKLTQGHGTQEPQWKENCAKQLEDKVRPKYETRNPLKLEQGEEANQDVINLAKVGCSCWKSQGMM